MTRKFTKALLAKVDDGVLEPRAVLLSALNYMSEADVEDLCGNEGFLDEPDEDDSEGADDDDGEDVEEEEEEEEES